MKGHNFELSATFDEIDPANYDGIWIPGGRAPEYLRMDEKVIELVKHFLNAGKPVGSLCHGPQILVATGCIEGRTMTCYPACSIELKLAGAIYKDAKEVGIEAVVDNNLITGVAWPSNPAVARAFLNALGVKVSFD